MLKLLVKHFRYVIKMRVKMLLQIKKICMNASNMLFLSTKKNSINVNKDCKQCS